jgi:hypothetical protein
VALLKEEVKAAEGLILPAEKSNDPVLQQLKLALK